MDLAFLEDELEKTLAIWQARLKDEEEENRSVSMTISKSDYIEDASSKAAPRTAQDLEAEINALMGGDILSEEQMVTNTEAACQETIQIVKETLAEVNPSEQTLSQQP